MLIWNLVFFACDLFFFSVKKFKLEEQPVQLKICLVPRLEFYITYFRVYHLYLQLECHLP